MVVMVVVVVVVAAAMMMMMMMVMMTLQIPDGGDSVNGRVLPGGEKYGAQSQVPDGQGHRPHHP